MSARDEFPMIAPSIPRSFRQTWELMVAEIDRLRALVEEKSLALIEARNPGIDMDEVKRLREEQAC